MLNNSRTVDMLSFHLAILLVVQTACLRTWSFHSKNGLIIPF